MPAGAESGTIQIAFFSNAIAHAGRTTSSNHIAFVDTTVCPQDPPPPPDETPPAVEFLEPDVGSTVRSGDAISARVWDETGLATVTIQIHYPDGVSECAYDGVKFTPLYASASTVASTTVSSNPGFQFSLRRALGGWPQNFTVQLSPVDGAGNRAAAASASASFVLFSDQPQTTPVTAPTLSPPATPDPLADVLGHGLIEPFQRDQKNDFAQDGGLRLVESSIRQILGTRGASPAMQGELPWRTKFGARFALLVNANNDSVTQELARVYAMEALSRWDSRVDVKNVTVSPSSSPVGGARSVLKVEIEYAVRQPNGGVLAEGRRTTVEV